MDHILYKIETKEGKFYIGYTRHKQVRFKRHIRDLLSKSHHNRNLQNIVNLEGIRSISIKEIGKYLTEEEARAEEERLIQEALVLSKSDILNINPFSVGGDTLSFHPRKTIIIEKRTESLKNTLLKMGPEKRSEKYGRKGEKNGMYGKTHTEKAKRSISLKNKGNTYALGSTRPESIKKVLSEKASKRTGENNPFYGKHHSIESKYLISFANKGKTPVNIRPVHCQGQNFPSLTQASISLNVSPSLLIYRIKSEKYPDYFYKTTKRLTTIEIEKKVEYTEVSGNEKHPIKGEDIV